MSGFNKAEKIIFATAMIALMAFSYFLYDDSLLFQQSNNSQLEHIGSVANSANDVRRKNLNTFSWMPASKKDEVFQNDSIFTGDRSEASIQLKDGSIIQIQPNSLITLNMKNGQMNLDLRYGNLVGELAQGSSLTVKSGTEEFNLENDPKTKQKSKIEFNKAHSGSVGLKLLSGKAALIDQKKQTKKELKENTPIKVSQKGEVKPAEPITLQLLGEKERSIVRINPDDSIPFEWKGQGDISRFELELSPEEHFNHISLSQLSTSSQVGIKDALEPGSYFWRVKAYDSNGRVAVTSPPHKLHLQHITAPKVLTPQEQAELTWEILIKKPEDLVAAVPLTWESSPLLVNFTWQLASDAEFTQLLKEESTPRNEALTPKLNNGTYWLRVRGETTNRHFSPWSSPVSFTMNLVAKREERPARPELVTKTIKFKPSQDREPAAVTAPQIVWKPVTKSKLYHVQIAKDLNFKEAQRFDVTTTQVEWSKYRPGRYFYRVYARGTNDLLSAPSEVGTLDIALQNPILNPFMEIRLVGQNPSPKEVAIHWTEIPFAKSYLVQMDTNSEFKNPTRLEYSSAGGKLKVPAPGKYSVRVQALDENNKPLTEFSNIEELLYSFRSPLTTPVLAEPFNGASIFLQKEMEPFIWLEWKKVAGAATYRIEISTDVDFSRILIARNLKENRFLIKERVPLGKLYWRVRAESEKESEISEWAEKREFTIYHQKNEGFVQ